MLRILLVIGFLVAAGATVLAIVSEDPLLLRLAVVLALWAALIAAFAVTRSRRDAKAAMLREGEAQVAYQLELQREVSARHEFEADLAAQMVATQSQQIAELREQLDRLTDVLSSLADGELLVSRLTLSAESARFRAGQPVLSGPEAAQVAHAGQADGGRELVRGAAVAVLEDTATAPGRVTEPPVEQEIAWAPPITAPPARPAGGSRLSRHAAAEPSPSETTGTESDVAQSDDGAAPASPPPPASGDHERHTPGTTSYPPAAFVTPKVGVTDEENPDEENTPVSTPAHHTAADAGTAAPGPAQAIETPAAPATTAPAPADEPKATSDHSETVSVDELLAAYGLTGVPRRRRRE